MFDISGVGSGAPTGAYITSLSSTDNAGIVQLGANQLVLTNASGTFAGSIQDGGTYGGTGGSLALAGGTETLTGVNTYTGGTVVLGGTLQMSGAGTLGAATGTSNVVGRHARSRPHHADASRPVPDGRHACKTVRSTRRSCPSEASSTASAAPPASRPSAV